MSIEVISIGSSSSGNSYIILAGGKTILLDVGLTAKRIIGAMSHFDIQPEEVDAVLVTHEHVDHVKSVRAIGRKCCNAVFYTSYGTYNNTPNFQYVPIERLSIVNSGDRITLGNGIASVQSEDFTTDHSKCSSQTSDADTGFKPDEDNATSPANNSSTDVEIGVFSLSHDASEPVSYTISTGGEKLAIVTDTGIITDEIYEAIHDADKLVFESNHDETLLMYGEYPYHVKVRIKSDFGHLSNKYAGETLARLLSERAEKCENKKPLEIMLAHLSFHNNAPYYARNTIEPILKNSGFEKDRDYTMTIASKDELTLL